MLEITETQLLIVRDFDTQGLEKASSLLTVYLSNGWEFFEITPLHTGPVLVTLVKWSDDTDADPTTAGAER